MDQSSALRMGKSGFWSFRSPVRTLCLTAVILGHLALAPCLQAAENELSAFQPARGKEDTTIKLALNLRLTPLPSEPDYHLSWYPPTSGRPKLSAEGEDLEGLEWTGTSEYIEDHKWDMGEPHNIALVSSDSAKIRSRSDPRPPAALDSSVESLLARMAQVKSSAPSSDRDRAGTSSTTQLTRTSADSASVDSLLARMSQAVSPGASTSSASVERPSLLSSARTEPAAPSQPLAQRADAVEPAAEVARQMDLPNADHAVKPASPSTNHAADAKPPPSDPTNSVAPAPVKSKTLAATSPAPVRAAGPQTNSETLKTRVMRTISTISSALPHRQSASVTATPAKDNPSPAADSRIRPTEPASPPARQVLSETSSAHTNSVVSPVPERKPVPSTNPALVGRLHLSAIAALGKRRAASINGQSIFQGEEAAFNVDGTTLKVRCLEIKDSSAVLQVIGLNGTTELKMPLREK